MLDKGFLVGGLELALDLAGNMILKPWVSTEMAREQALACVDGLGEL